ncbi:hypothetical protein BSKO_09957 [Bryopsis sp. KO-2023]|nr:hypothetical protein BSKO_09957 [Bryopsis sp. KO-2023]
MCGRARCSLAPEEFAQHAGVSEGKWKNRDKYRPDYNAGPGTWMPVVKAGDDGTKELETMRWGLIPSFTKSGTELDFFRMFNARLETLLESPVFRRLVTGRRCVVIVNGFYEWHNESESRKQPYYACLGPNEVMRFAGLYDCWHDGNTGENLHTFTMITTDCSPRIKWLHNRMPVILRSKSQEAEWLNSKGAIGAKLFTPYNGEDLVWHPVTHEMGKRTFKGPECCKDVRKNGIARFFQRKAVRKEVTVKTEQKQETKQDPDQKFNAEALIKNSTSDSEEDEGLRVTRLKRKRAALSGTVPRAPPSSPVSLKRSKTNQPSIAAYFPRK